MLNTTAANSSRKPEKPSPDFPLTPRTDGRWMKKIHGKIRYFTGTAEEALTKYENLIVSLGQDQHERLQIRDLCERFMCSKLTDLEAGQITKRTFAQYHAACDTVVLHFGKLKPLDELTPEDANALRARLVKGLGPATQAGRIAKARSVFFFGLETELITRPFHRWLKTVGRRVLKSHHAQQPSRLLEAHEIRLLIETAKQPMKAFILLAINCAFGNSDCADLKIRDLDLETGWHHYARHKTGEPRRAKLWPETVQAVREALAHRFRPRDPAHADRVFLTHHGHPWVSDDRTYDALGNAFAKLTAAAGIARRGMTFYSLRHCFETVAGGSRDQVAVNLCMGAQRSQHGQPLPPRARRSATRRRGRACTRVALRAAHRGRPAAGPADRRIILPRIIRFTLTAVLDPIECRTVQVAVTGNHRTGVVPLVMHRIDPSEAKLEQQSSYVPGRD